MVIYLEYFMENWEKIVFNPTVINLVVSFTIFLRNVETEHNIEDLKKNDASLF